MPFCTLLRFVVAPTLMLLLSPALASAQFAWGLVNRVLHAEARTGNVTDLPPDRVLGANFGSFSHAAEAINPPYVARAAVSSWMLSNGMQSELSGEVSPRLTIDPQSRSSVLMEFDVFGGTPQFSLSYYTVHDPLGPPEYSGDVVIRRAGGGPVVFEHQMERFPFPAPPPTVRTFPLTAGRYELLVDAAPIRSMGGAAGGEAFVRMTGPTIPEPAGAATVLVTFAFAAVRPRPRAGCRVPPSRARAVVQSRSHV